MQNLIIVDNGHLLRFCFCFKKEKKLIESMLVDWIWFVTSVVICHSSLKTFTLSFDFLFALKAS